MELNTDFTMNGMTAQELTAVVAAWQKSAISLDTMLHLFRKGEILPEGRTTEEEAALIAKDGTAKYTNHTNGADGTDGTNGATTGAAVVKN